MTPKQLMAPKIGRTGANYLMNRRRTGFNFLQITPRTPDLQPKGQRPPTQERPLINNKHKRQPKLHQIPPTHMPTPIYTPNTRINTTTHHTTIKTTPHKRSRRNLPYSQYTATEQHNQTQRPLYLTQSTRLLQPKTKRPNTTLSTHIQSSTKRTTMHILQQGPMPRKLKDTPRITNKRTTQLPLHNRQLNHDNTRTRRHQRQNQTLRQVHTTTTSLLQMPTLRQYQKQPNKYQQQP